MLRSLQLEPVYDSSTCHLVSELVSPVMARSVEYFRGVGYFSSGWLREATEGLVSLVERGGKGRVVLSPILSPVDWEAFRKGGEARRDERLRAVLQGNISDLAQSLKADTLNCLAWLIADDLLEFRFAVPRPEWSAGDYHDKVWVFTDECGDRVALHGSFNDSIKGTLNGEAVSVFKSWEPGQAGYVEMHKARLDDLWLGINAQFTVHTIPEACREALIKLRTSSDRPYTLPEGPRPTVRTREPSVAVKLREFQSEAVAAWIAHGRKGILEMATGTGKTFTALSAAACEYTERGQLALVVLVPYLHLLEQWKRHCERFGFSPVLCSGEHGSWHIEAASRIRSLRSGVARHVCLLAVHKTATTERFAKLVKSLPGDLTLLIGDEVHALGAPHLQQALAPDIEMRLGLSATPDRWLDDAGTAVLNKYFGGVCYRFTLEQAITGGFLVPYEYHPILVNLTDEEMERYEELTAKIAVLSARAEDKPELRDALKRLLIERARVIWTAQEKLPRLLSLVSEIMTNERAAGQRLHHALVYCAPGEHSAALSELSGLGLNCHEFVYRVSMAERERVLGQFERGSIEALVAIRCLDEGVDVPATRLAFFLASSMNPRQFVQRRGRILRLAEGKERATVYDFLVVPARGERAGSPESARSLLRREMPRFVEFSSGAVNRFSAREVVFDLLNDYGMLNLLEDTPWDIYKKELRGETAATLADDPIIGGDLNV